MTKAAVIGNSQRNIGAACAADLVLGGHEVRYYVFPEGAADLQAVREHGGFEVQGDPAAFVSGRTGKAAVHAVCDDMKEALAGAEAVVLDASMAKLERQFETLIPWLPQRAVVYVQSYGYWAAARLAPLLRANGRDDVLVCEAAAPTHAASLTGHILKGGQLRRGIEVASVPGNRIDEALKVLRTLFPGLIAAPSVLQTSLESVNLMIHPAMVLLGVGLMERAESQDGKVSFYRDCNVPSAGRLAEAMDEERGRICQAYGVRHRTLTAAIDHYYGTSGDSVQEAVLNCAFYQSVRPGAPTTWRGWAAVDVPYAIVPLVLLAEQAGIGAPLHRSLAEILGNVLGIDPWTCGPSLDAMNLVGPAAQVARRFQ
jgi:opine dehydrogenase